MTIPLVGSTTLAMLQQAARRTLVHEVTLATLVSIRIPGSAGKYSKVWVPRRPEPGRLRPANPATGTTRIEQQADVGDWILHLVAGSPVAVNDRATVEGRVRGPGGRPVDWTRVVRVKAVEAPDADEAVRNLLCQDEELQRA